MTAPPRILSTTLLADGGAAAAGPDFFRSTGFLRAEGVTHTVVTDDGRLAVPVIVREIPGCDAHDAISPYGYPGARRDGPEIDVRDLDLAPTGLVSLFLRERLGMPALRGGRARQPVLLHDPAVPRQLNRRTATKARSTERAGYACSVVPGPQAGPDLLAGFHAAYTQTMTALGAAERYRYSPGYLASCLREDSARLVVVHGPDGDVASAALAVVSDGVLHYHLGGTADAHRPASPAKNMMIAMMDLADRTGLPLNLGGGTTEGDSLHRFKSLFTNATDVFTTHDLIGEADAYRNLSRGAGSADGFFPAYRSPATRG